MWHEPHALLAEGDKLQDKLRCSVAKIDHPGRPVRLEASQLGNACARAEALALAIAGEKSWNDARFSHLAGVPTPRPRAYFERRLGPFKRSSYLLSDYIAGTSLYRFMRFERPTPNSSTISPGRWPPSGSSSMTCASGTTTSKPKTCWSIRTGKVWLIDFERMRRFRNRDRLRRRQVRDINDFFHPRNWRQNPAAAEVFRRELLKTPAVRETFAGPNGAEHPLAKPRHKDEPQFAVRHRVDPVPQCGRHDCRLHRIRARHGGRNSRGRLGFHRRHAAAGSRTGWLPDHPSACDDDIDFANWAESHAKHSWIFRLLPNEQLNSELGRQIQDAVAAEPREDGFRVLRTFFFAVNC